MNNYIGVLEADYRAELARKLSAEDNLRSILDENNNAEMVWNTQRFAEMTQMINKQSSQIEELSNVIQALAVDVRTSKSKSFIGKFFNQ